VVVRAFAEGAGDLEVWLWVGGSDVGWADRWVISCEDVVLSLGGMTCLQLWRCCTLCLRTAFTACIASGALESGFVE
jgi:hypothetical protein